MVERAVGAQDHARADVVEDGAEAFLAEQAVARAVQRGDLQEIEVNVVRPGGVALDAVIETDAEAVEGVGILQALVNLDLVGDGSPGGLARPVDERTGAHVVPATGAGGQDEGTHLGSGKWEVGTRKRGSREVGVWGGGGGCGV